MYDQQLRHERYHQQNNDALARPADSNPAHAAIKLGVILLFVVYLYALVKIILFKFGSISPAYYLRELVDHILHPGMIADLLRWPAILCRSGRSRAISATWETGSTS